MATTSFNKNFVVSDKKSIRQLKADINSPRKVFIKEYDRKAENAKGIKLLKQRLSSLAHC
ncbi:hypothetical protein ACR30L_12025 [Psychromonas sp. PT13]|uniref:hypothetical protein n=1 Tax=Psychromonas sp. PT13 TaxID=3439547 RepID=UPI003EC040CA